MRFLRFDILILLQVTVKAAKMSLKVTLLKVFSFVYKFQGIHPISTKD